MNDIEDLLSELVEANFELKRSERDYSVCLLTGARCRDEQRAVERARRRVKQLEKRLKAVKQ